MKTVQLMVSEISLGNETRRTARYGNDNIPSPYLVGREKNADKSPHVCKNSVV